MTVEFEAINEDCFCFEIANQTWFHLLDNTGIGKIVNPRHTNDPVRADKETALKCAEALRWWEPDQGWYVEGKEEQGKQMLLDFFENCDGFKTY